MPFHYREMIARLFAAHGFAEYLTSEPNIRMDPANILVARLGSRIDAESMNRFFQRLLCTTVVVQEPAEKNDPEWELYQQRYD